MNGTLTFPKVYYNGRVFYLSPQHWSSAKPITVFQGFGWIRNQTNGSPVT